MPIGEAPKNRANFIARQCARSYRNGRLLAALLLFLPFISSGAATAQVRAGTENLSQLCDRAAAAASRAFSVPLDVMQAITRTETGRPGSAGLQPWPWTVNMEGAGRWFASEDEARAYVFRHFKRGARSFDVGCFQINYKWHGAAFRSIDDMFDPQKNALYAAEFLKNLYRELGNWSDAAGAYHSRTPEFAERYTARFERIRSSLSADTEIAQQSSPRPLFSRNPGLDVLGDRGHSGSLTGRGSPSLGSLVPMESLPQSWFTTLIALN